MKIVILASCLGSLGNHDYRLLKGLIERNNSVFLVSFHPENPSDDIKKINGAKIYHDPPKKLVFIQRVFYFNRIKRLKELLNYLKPDVLISINTWNNSMLGALSGFRPHIAIPHGSDILIAPHKWLFIKYLNYIALKKADLIAADCIAVKNEICSRYNIKEKKIMIFTWGIETDIFRPSSKTREIKDNLGWSNNQIIIMNRHFENIYGILDFIDSLPYVINHLPDVRIFLVGDGRLKERIKQKIKDYKLSDFIYMPGKIPRTEMVSYLNNADLYVSSSYSDGSSVSLLEAMSCGLPVVCTNVPSNLEWITPGRNGLVVERGNPIQLSDAIVSLLKRPDLRREMSIENRDVVVKRGDWEINIKRLETACLGAIQRQRPEGHCY
ncbi:glycosyltransferase family 4 protein [Candidatus Gottesmanbacteria bacterium]|nr:glycosyltransferase family 4 protein [Candidatus Gottesmanbacteria bacterium]MBM3712099.1 glycosyltransferase family 4 protein [Actinomycetota bacterium]